MDTHHEIIMEIKAAYIVKIPFSYDRSCVQKKVTKAQGNLDILNRAFDLPPPPPSNLFPLKVLIKKGERVGGNWVKRERERNK